MKPGIVSIAVSGQCSTGKSTFARVLATKLYWKYVDVGSEFKRIAEEQHLQIQAFGSIPDKLLREIDEETRVRMTNEHGVVWDSRLSCYLARDNKTVFKVYCKADLYVRAQRTAKRDNIAFEKAIQLIQARDREEMEVFKRLYGISNIYNENWTDLVIDTSRRTPDELADTVIRELDAL